MAVTYSPLRSRSNSIEGVVVVSRDLTQHKQDKVGRANLEYAVDNAMEGISLHDENGMFTYVNPAEARMYGYEVHELLGKSWKEQHQGEQLAEIEKEILPLLHTRGNGKVI